MLEHVEGRGVPVDSEVVLDTVLVEAVTWLRDFHDLVDGFRPDGAGTWRGPGEVELSAGQIICHQDPGACNWIIQSGHFVAMIDWDLAGLSDPIEDLAFLAWTAIPLFREIPVEDVARRLDLLVAAYGEWGPTTVLEAFVAWMSAAGDRIEAGQDRSDQGLRNLVTVGEPQRTRDRVAAFRRRIPEIEVALS